MPRDDGTRDELTSDPISPDPDDSTQQPYPKCPVCSHNFVMYHEEGANPHEDEPIDVRAMATPFRMDCPGCGAAMEVTRVISYTTREL